MKLSSRSKHRAKFKAKSMSVAEFIDHTILKPTTTIAEIRTICEEAVEYGFAAVCIPPYFVKEGRENLMNGKTKLATVIGFPFGYSHYTAKLAEANQALEDGADELDIVMNILAFKNNDLAYLETEMGALTKLADQKKATVKLIIESGILTNEEIVKCCELFKHFSIGFMKTSTGYAEKGASVEAVQLMRAHLPSTIQIKASGGIRTYEFAKKLIDAGATRLGCSASVAIVKGEVGSGY
jgi:deoxyribose-phosphate aldolase